MKGMLRVGVGVVLVVLMSVVCVCAETYYVRPDGKSSNTGLGNSPDQAWGAIQYAADNATPGDTILIQEGTYPEAVTIRNTGSPELPITFRGVGTVRLGGMRFPSSPVFSAGVAYYTNVENLVFDGTLGIVSYYASGMTLSGAGYVKILGCTFENYTDDNGSDAGIVFSTNGWRSCFNITVKDTLFRNNNTGVGAGLFTSSIFDNCRFVGNSTGYSIYSWGTSYTTFNQCTFENNGIGAAMRGVYWYWLKTHDNLFKRCIFTNNGTGLLIGQETAQDYSSSTYATTVVNSDFYNNRESGILVRSNFSGTNDGNAAYYESRGQTITNNIFLGNGSYGIDNSLNRILFSSYNIAYQNGIAPALNVPFTAGNFSLTSDPLLTNPGAGDFSLRYGSPCVDAGNPAYDSDPAKVGDHIDIGVIEQSLNPIQAVTTLAATMDKIPESYFKNMNNSLPLSKKLFVALQMVQRADKTADTAQKANFYNSAIQKLKNDILPKTDGCAASGAPDNNDWITACETQAEFYGPIVSMIEMLQAR